MSRVPSNSVNSPRTVAMPMCLTAKPTFECAGSTVQVPVGTMVMAEVVVLISMLSSVGGCISLWIDLIVGTTIAGNSLRLQLPGLHKWVVIESRGRGYGDSCVDNQSRCYSCD